VKVNVLVYAPNKAAELREIDHESLEDIQAIIGGYMELEYFRADQDLILICNADGIRDNLPLNRKIDLPYSGSQDILGTFFIARQKGYDIASLNESDIEMIKGIIK
jgi:hypothetical protein